MIFDSITNLGCYGEDFKAIADYLAENDVKNMEAGRYTVNDRIYLSIQDYTTKPKNDNVCEVHRKYVDVQYMVTGGEKMFLGLSSYIENLPKIPYNDEKDVAHHNAGYVMDCMVPEGFFCVFLAGEYHKPGVCIYEPEQVRKALFKIEK